MGCSFSSFRFNLSAAMDANDWLAFGDGAIASAVLLVEGIAVRYSNTLSAFRANQIVVGRPFQNSRHRANHNKQCHGNCGTKCTAYKNIAANKCDHGKHHEDNTQPAI